VQIAYIALLLFTSSIDSPGGGAPTEYGTTGAVGCLSIVTSVATNKFEYGLEDTLRILVRVQNTADHKYTSCCGERTLEWTLCAADGTPYCSPEPQDENEYTNRIPRTPAWELGPGETIERHFVIPIARLVPCNMIRPIARDGRMVIPEFEPIRLPSGTYQITAGIDSGNTLPRTCVTIHMK